MMTDEHNFIMLMETPNAIETEKNIKVLSISWFNNTRWSESSEVKWQHRATGRL